MGQIRRRFSVEFKRDVVLQIESGELRVSEASRQYKIARELIERWRKLYAKNQLVEKSSVRERELEKENQRLKIKLGELVLENDHLKKLHDWAARNQSEDSVVINPTNLDPSHKDAE